MSKTRLRNVTFTPLIDNLVEDVGVIPAAVFGRVWRYCQMHEGYCHAEQERIADDLGLSRQTVNAALKKLVSKEYLSDATPNTKGRTRIYRDTGKAGIVVILEPVNEVVNQPVNEVVKEPVKNFDTKTLKTEKKEKIDTDTTTSSSSVSIFLKNATQEELEAFHLVRRFSNEEKAIDVAQRENPIEAAKDFLEWSSDHGNRVARKIFEEVSDKEYEEQRNKANKRNAESIFVELCQKRLVECNNDIWLRWINYAIDEYTDGKDRTSDFWQVVAFPSELIEQSMDEFLESELADV